MLESYILCYCLFNQQNGNHLLPCTERAFNSFPLDANAYTPFEIDLGYNPNSPLDELYIQDDIHMQRLDIMIEILSSSVNYDIFTYKLSEMCHSN